MSPPAPCGLFAASLALLVLCQAAPAAESATREGALNGMRRAAEFFRGRVAVEGGYVWRCAGDLSRREGEEQTTATMAWIQPPGTPAVGGAYLRAYEATGDDYYLDAARETALALVRGQLRSGGWGESIEFDPQKRGKFAYRVDADSSRGANVSTLDDDKTQSCIRFLARVDRALKFEDAVIHEAAVYALKALVEAQYPNGAWPQKFSGPHHHDSVPVKKASYPADWSKTYSPRNYGGDYTLNDGTLSDAVETLLEAAEIYGDQGYEAAAIRGGDFLLLAQLPNPQPAWAQQYDRDMHPVWARKFEPPAVTGGESQSAMRTLLRVYQATRDAKYLEPIPQAIDYLRRSRLPNGRLARFYELRTNRPLYFTRDYRLTYSDDDLPTHYSFQAGDRLDGIERDYQRARSREVAPEGASPVTAEERSRRETNAARVLAALDSQGRWTESGRLRTDPPGAATVPVIDSRTFIRNLNILCEFLDTTK